MGMEKAKGFQDGIAIRVLAAVAALALGVLVLVTGAACSSSTSSTGGNQTVNGYSVSEYNADVDNLSRILGQAKDLDHRIEAMGNPNEFTSQEQVDQYNSLVERYNSVSSEYNAAAKAFSSKYGNTIDGAGTRPTDPDNIDLPTKK